MQGVRRLLGAGIDSARLDAELLLGCALGMSRERSQQQHKKNWRASHTLVSGTGSVGANYTGAS